MVISNTGMVVAAISAVNECVTLFQRVRSLWSHWNRTENQEEGDVPKLQSSLGSHSSGTEKQELKEDDVLKLQISLDTLPAMYNFTDQAQILPEPKVAVCDMQDLLEDFRCYQQKAKIEGSATSAEPGTRFFHDFIQGGFSKLIHIQQRLHNQYRLLEEMSLHQSSPWFDGSVRPDMTSFLTEEKIFGRNDEIKELIRMLGVPGPSRFKRKTSATITSVPVLPIVGIGGVGKTTLAQIICHHPQVQKHFHVVIWICVSDDFDVRRLTKEAIEQFSGKAVTEDNLDSLQVDLADSINKRRFLVVLDNMCSENGELWKTFYAPFKHALEGSMMLVTTRSPKVADVVHTVVPFLLEGLKDDDLYSFFKLCAFGSDSYNNNQDPVLEWIGKQIVPKLKGSPLATKICGRLLGMNLDPTHWNSILKSRLWELRQEVTDILPILELSYMYLPLHLKKCFAFFALFPYGYNFMKEDLVDVWVAEGFVVYEPNIPLREIAGKYFEELEHLSFFQKLRGKYVMHDLIHDLALHVAMDEKKDLERIPQTGIPPMLDPQHFASTSAGTQAATSFHTDVPPMWSHPMSTRQRGQIDSDSSILKVCMNKDMSNALHREKQARKKDSKSIKRDLRQIKKLRTEAGYGYGSGAQSHPGASSSSALQQHQQYGQSYAPGGGYGFPYGFGGQFHPGASSSSALQQHQQYGQSYAPGGGYGFPYGFGGQFHPGASSSSALQQHQQYGQSYAPGGGYGYGLGGQFHPGASSSALLPPPSVPVTAATGIR